MKWPCGDDCLKRIARCIKDTIKRPTDLIARYGGEEFVVMLPHTTLKGATRLVKSILEAIARLNIPHVQSPISDRIPLAWASPVSCPRSTCDRDPNDQCGQGAVPGQG